MDTEKLFNSEKEDKLILSFNKILKQFLKELHKVFPEYNIIKLKEYKNLDDNDDRFLLYFMNFIEKDIEKIINEDISLFEHEDTYFLRDIEFSRIWNSGISDNNKKAIWKFLQTLYLIGKPFKHNMPDINSLISEFNSQIQDTSKDKESLKKIKKQLDIISHLVKNLNEEKEQRKKENKAKMEGQLPEFIEKSKIGQLAQELSSELDLEELGFGNLDDNTQDPQNLFNNILGKNPQKLMGLIQNVGSKIQNKLSDGGFDESDLVGEAQEMMSSLNMNDMLGNMFKDGKMNDLFKNMGNMFGNNPEMQNMFNNIDPQDFSNFANQFGQNMAQGKANTDMRVDQNKVKNMEAKARLKKKLAQRRKQDQPEIKTIESSESEKSLSIDSSNQIQSGINENGNSEKKIRKKKKNKPPPEVMESLKQQNNSN